MNNQIFDLKKKFDFNCLNLGNPSLLNNNNYFSKLSHGSINKNVYIQLPKCLTKQGIVKNSNKTFCELNYNICDKQVIDFFESLERFCITKILENKELWFYNSSNLTENDIEELVTPIIKTYRQGKRFLIKAIIKNDKFNIYDENENTIDLNDYNIEHEFVPLINVNGLKFSSKNFTIELILCQMMVVYPEDEFEKQLLIKVDKPNKQVNSNESTLLNSNNTLDKSNAEISNVETSNAETLDNKNNSENLEKVVEMIDITDLDSELQENNNSLETKEIIDKDIVDEEKPIENIHESDDDVNTLNLENNTTLLTNDLNEKMIEVASNDLTNTDKNSTLEKVEKNIEKNLQENVEKETNNKFDYLFNSNLEEIDTTNMNVNDNNESFEIKSRDSIYLEIYKKAKQKAKEIRKNAVQAFLEAKNIKNKYNLQTLLESDSSDEEFFDLDN